MKKRILLVLLIGVMLLSLLAMTFASCGDDEEPETPPDTPSDTPSDQTPGGTVTIPGITPDYPAPPVEEGAEDATDGEDKMNVAEGTTGAGIEYTTEYTIDISDKKLSLYFRNPNRSLQNAMVQLMIQDQVIAESGLIVPGKRISTLPLKDGVSVTPGVYASNAKLVVRFYDPQTNACSIVKSEILVTVTAQE